MNVETMLSLKSSGSMDHLAREVLHGSFSCKCYFFITGLSDYVSIFCKLLQTTPL